MAVRPSARDNAASEIQEGNHGLHDQRTQKVSVPPARAAGFAPTTRKRAGSRGGGGVFGRARQTADASRHTPNGSAKSSQSATYRRPTSRGGRKKEIEAERQPAETVAGVK